MVAQQQKMEPVKALGGQMQMMEQKPSMLAAAVYESVLYQQLRKSAGLQI